MHQCTTNEYKTLNRNGLTLNVFDEWLHSISLERFKCTKYHLSFLFVGTQKNSLILADSLTKGFFEMSNTEVITRRGGTPQKAIDFIRSKPHLVSNYKVIVLHVGTNWLGSKEEWGLYLQKVNSKINSEEFETRLRELNPPPAAGNARNFLAVYHELIDQIRRLNPNATILVSSIIPRLWDQNRRHLVRISYNNILKSFNKQPNVYFIPSYKPFFDLNKNLKTELFEQDGLLLSNNGAVVLRTFFCEKIDKAMKGKLK